MIRIVSLTAAVSIALLTTSCSAPKKSCPGSTSCCAVSGAAATTKKPAPGN